jgi:hypothetical protein
MSGGFCSGCDTPGLPSGADVRSVQCRSRILDHSKDRLVDDAVLVHRTILDERDGRLWPNPDSPAQRWVGLLVGVERMPPRLGGDRRS